MARDSTVHSDYDDGFEKEYLRGFAWVLGGLAVLVWVWLLNGVDGPRDVKLGFGLVALGTSLSVASGVSAVLCGLKHAEQRLAFRMRRD